MMTSWFCRGTANEPKVRDGREMIRPRRFIGDLGERGRPEPMTVEFFSCRTL